MREVGSQRRDRGNTLQNLQSLEGWICGKIKHPYGVCLSTQLHGPPPSWFRQELCYSRSLRLPRGGRRMEEKIVLLGASLLFTEVSTNWFEGECAAQSVVPNSCFLAVWCSEIRASMDCWAVLEHSLELTSAGSGVFPPFWLLLLLPSVYPGYGSFWTDLNRSFICLSREEFNLICNSGGKMLMVAF